MFVFPPRGAPPVPIRVSGDVANRYAVERELGRGATAVVYLAHDLEHGRKVALKVLRRELIESVGVARFQREIRLTAQLHHPHIVPVLGSGEIDGELFVVLPYMDGGTLRDRLDRERQLPVQDVVAIGAAIASALTCAHGRGLLHRDVKPENILFTAGQACLADFGIARALYAIEDEHSTTTGTVRGTPAYMSPEQAAGERELDARSDVYSLACVLYEALAGIQAFVGPTAQAVLAQRMYHEPRPLRVYRPSAPTQLEAALAKALAIVPADRYQTAQAFRDALLHGLEAPAAPVRAWRPSRRQTVVGLAGMGVIAAAFVTMRSAMIRPANVETPLDTTRIAVLPFARDTAVPLSVQAADYVIEALLRWDGVRPADQFQVADAVAQRGPSASAPGEAARIALEAGAGRFIRGRVAPLGDSVLVELMLYDHRSRSPLRAASGRLPRTNSYAERLFRALVDSILIGGSTRSATTDLHPGTSSLPATQAFVAGLAALDEWDLAKADSLFGDAIKYDSKFGRARVWQGQVSDWRQLSPRQYAPSIDAALADSGTLTDRERAMARALSLLGHGDFQAACRTYDSMRQRDERDFAAWFGMARCQSLDDAVVPDPRSPSKWSYRSSYHRAVQAYAYALQLLPSTYRGFERGGLDALEALLFTRGDRVRMGRSATTNGTFVAKPSWSGDTLAFVPFPISAVSASVADPTSKTKAEALRRQRAIFRDITTTWARAFPNSPGAKEAFAISLDMLGDRAAADSLRKARLLAHDEHDRARLGAVEAVLRLKVALPDDARGLEGAASLADSVLRGASQPRSDEADAELPLASFLGRCTQAADLARRVANEMHSRAVVPGHLIVGARVATIQIATSCGRGRAQATIDSMSDGIRAAAGTAAEAGMAELSYLGQAVSLAFPDNASLLQRLLKTAPNPLFEAQLATLEHDIARARLNIERVRDARRQSQLRPGDGSPDAVLTETRVMLALHDTSAATEWLDAALGQITDYSPTLFTLNNAAAGSLVQAMVLRAELARAAGNARLAKRWATPVAILWRHADAPLRGLSGRMQQLAGLP